MQIKPRSYPHPVLSYFGDDVVGSTFQSTIRVKPTKTNYAFEAIFKTSNADLASAVKARKAVHAVHVECATTRYRHLFRAFDETFTFEVPASLLDGRVELCSFILSDEERANYRIRGANADYGPMAFAVQKADTLAVGPDHTFIAEKRVDPLRRIPSIFVITQSDAEDAPPIDINLIGEKITLTLSRQNFEAYRFLSKAQPLHPVLCSMVIIPALVSIVEHMRGAASNSDELTTYESRRWFGVLSKRMKSQGVDVRDAATFRDSSLVIAQRLVGNPVAEGLKALQEYEQEPESE